MLRLGLLTFLLLVAIVNASSLSALNPHSLLYPWNVNQVRSMLVASTKVRDLGGFNNVPSSLFGDLAELVAQASSGILLDIKEEQRGRMLWFERQIADYKDQGVLVLNEKIGHKLIEFNVTLPHNWIQKAKSKSSAATQLTVMSFNIRYGTANDGINSWPLREELVYELLNGYNADFLGLQEALKFQIDDIIAFTKGYAYIGVGRDDGVEAGEYSAILYKVERFTVLESGTFWFCFTPTVPGCQGDYGNSLPRISTWGRFVDRATQKTFYMYNLHLDNASPLSRDLSVQQLLRDIQTRTGGKSLVIVTGDYNEGEDFVPVLRMKAGGFVDTFRVMYPNATNVGTFNAFVGDTTGDKIDYVFGSNANNVGGFVKVLGAAIIRDNKDGRYPSDHFPVIAEMILPD